MTDKPRFIVAEVSKNWIAGAELHPERGLLAEQFERVINTNATRGYHLVTFSLHRLMTRADQLNETIIAVFEETPVQKRYKKLPKKVAQNP
jgi:hypothetical protein